MGFWFFSLGMVLLLPLTMLVMGLLFLYRPPRRPNGGWGYRTARSRKSLESWAFAQRCCGRFWFRAGQVLLPLTVLFFCLLLKGDKDTIGFWTQVFVYAQLLPLLAVIPVTERALKRNFQ